MDTRLIAFGAAALLGAGAGTAMWTVSGGGVQAKALSVLDGRLNAISTRTRQGLDRPSDALAQAVATPLLGAMGGAGQDDVAIQLFGVVRTPARNAALLVIGAAAPLWVEVGQERDGVALRAVSGSNAQVATANGEREVTLGAPGVAPGAPSVSPTPPGGGPPPGFRSPPPPASAPGVK